MTIQWHNIQRSAIHTLLIVGTNIAKSGPSCNTNEHSVSITAIRRSILGSCKVLTRGWIIREAWSEKLILRERPSIVSTAFFRRDIGDVDLSYDRTITGITRWRYSSIFLPKVRNASIILMRVFFLSTKSPSNAFNICTNKVEWMVGIRRRGPSLELQSRSQ